MLASVALVTGYLIILGVVAVRARAAREYSEFSLAKRSLPLALIFGSLCAAYVGPAFSIGFVGRGFQSGLLFLLIGLAYSAQNIFVGLFIAPRLRSLSDCHTLGDAIGHKYNRTCQILAGVISVGLCMGFAAVMAKAAGVVIHDVFGIPRWAAIIGVAFVTTLYTCFGGLQASVMTDAVQFVLFTILMPAILLFALFVPLHDGGAALAYELKTATTAGFQSVSWVQILGLVTAFLLGETLIPPYANRALATRSTSASRNSFVLAGLFSIVWFTVMISLGIVARAIVPPETAEDNVLLTLVRTIKPPGGYAMVLVALLSVIISSLDSLMNGGAVAFTQDIVKPFVRVSDETSLVCGRLATVAIAAVAGVAAMAVPRIIDGLLMCYTVWAPAMLPTAVLGLWLARPRPLAGILSMTTGATMALSLQFVWHYTPEEPTILLALGAAVAAYWIGHLLSPFCFREVR